MFNLTLATDRDRKEAAKVERRRAVEEERKKRIFNPRQRLFGVDYGALERQIEEKKQRDEEAARVNKIFDEQRKQDDKIALSLVVKEKQERLKIEQEINEFRMCCQRPEDRREFDLNDPNQMKKDVPARTCDDDPRCGPSSAQKFEGEDLTNTERLKIQKDQIKAWLQQQIKEKEAADKERQAAEEAYREAVLARDQRAIQLDCLEKDCRKRLEHANLRFNRALADEKKLEAMRDEKQQNEDRLAEMYNFLTSDMLTENPDVAQSNLGPHRKIGYMYKGMTDEERKEVRKCQLAQIEEAKKKKEMEEKMNREYNDYINGTQRTIHLMDKEEERKKRENTKQLAEENRKLAEEQRKQREFMEKIVFANKATPDFYSQFNTSTR